MKVLWFIPIPPKAALERRGQKANSTGFWIHSLIDLISRRDDLKLAVAYEDRGSGEAFVANGVEYFPIPALGRIRGAYGLEFGHTERLLEQALHIIERYRPDVVHVHGVESAFGLVKARKLARVPLVISLQGMMEPWGRVAWGDKSLWDVLKMQRLWDAVRGFPSLRSRRNFLRRAVRERAMLQAADGVLGRTDFDQAFAWSVSPQARYYRVGEVLRESFYSSQWSEQEFEPYTLFTSGRLTLQKGIHVAINAVAMLRTEFPALKLCIGGDTVPTGEFRYLERLVRNAGLSEVVEFAGWLSEGALVAKLRKSHVYLNPSFIENSSNAVGEAMLMGMPCVVSMVGGTGSMVQHGHTGLLYPPDQVPMLAYEIRRLFMDKALAVRLGRRAREVAAHRHSPVGILADLIKAYRASMAVTDQI